VRWSAHQPAALVSQESGANTVFAVESDGDTCFLRLTDPASRTLEDVEGEVAFLAHLSAYGVRVAMPVPSSAGRVIETVDGCFAVLFRRAIGMHVTPSDAAWSEDLFRAWGITLAQQHEASLTFRNPYGGWRQDWRLEPVMRDGLAMIEAQDAELARAAAGVLSALERSRPALGEVGMIHADFAPQNFRYDLGMSVTAFDFANCCCHWFLYDLAVSRSVLRLQPEREKLALWMANGYQEVRPLPGDDALMSLLLKLRTLYVYCYRSRQFGEAPSADQTGRLDELRKRFLQGPFW